jgi:spermidine synthase
MGLIYFRDGDVVVESGDVSIYNMDGKLYLEKGPGHNLWALEDELVDYVDQLASWPTGDCLEIGLGLGVASKYILSFPNVGTLTTIELDSDVIMAQKIANPIKDKRHLVLNAHGLFYLYETPRMFDFIFLDFYKVIDADTLPEIADMVTAANLRLKSDGKLLGWLDKHTTGDDYLNFMALFND